MIEQSKTKSIVENFKHQAEQDLIQKNEKKALMMMFITGRLGDVLILALYMTSYHIINRNINGNCHASQSMVPLFDKHFQIEKRLHYHYQDYNGLGHENYAEYYTNVSLRLKIYIGIQILIYITSIVRETIRLNYPRINIAKGGGYYLHKMGVPLQIVRYIGMFLLTNYFFSFKAQVCMCKYRGYFYQNCYIVMEEDDVTNQMFNYQCYPKNEKYELMSQLINEEGVSTYQIDHNSYMCL